MMKFLVGSGCCPLKIRKPRPATKAPKIKTLTSGEYSRLRRSSLRVRRRRNLREARPRLTNRLRLMKSNMSILGRIRIVGGPMTLIGIDDGTNQLVAYHIAFGKINNSDPERVLQRLQRFNEPGALIWRQVDLRHVARDDALGTRAHASQKHEHLFRGRVLGFVEDDEGVAQGPPAHVGERCNLDDLPRH